MQSAPSTCPQCGEEKGWRCINDHAGDEMGPVKKTLIQGAFGLVGLGIAKAFRRGKNLQYRCDRCGFEATYNPD